ncbi:hypothetical protein KIL84_012655, partial [Mauremys mutica]
MEAALRPASAPHSFAASSTSALVRSAPLTSRESLLVPKKRHHKNQDKSRSLVLKGSKQGDRDSVRPVSGRSPSLAPQQLPLSIPAPMPALRTRCRKYHPPSGQHTGKFAVLSIPEAFAAARDLLTLPVPGFLEIQDSAQPVLMCASQNAPEYPETEQQQCVRREHPTIAFEDLKPWVSNFTYPGVHDFSQLALDANRNQLVVGARNYLFRLSLHNVSLIQATEWGSDEDTRRSCQSKGKTEEECQNYVRVLIVYGKKVFTCGTNAFSPVCSSRQ